jgi:hypothetical protein
MRGLAAGTLVALLGFVVGCGSQPVAATTPTPPPQTVTVTTTVPSPPRPLKKASPLPTIHHTRTSSTAKATPVPPVAAPEGTDTSLTTYTDDGAVVELDDGSVWSIDIADQSTVTGWSDGDAMTTNSAGDTLIDTDQSETASATEIGSMTDTNAYAGSGTSIAALGDDGSILTLDDGSVWAINDLGDQSTVTGWSDGDPITVADNSDGTYTLANGNDNSTVSANYIGNE